MDLRCPHCHKHTFPISSVFMLGEHGRYSGFNRPLECPHCGASSRFPSSRQTLIDLLTLVGCGLGIVIAAHYLDDYASAPLWAGILGVGLGVVARYMAIRSFAVLVVTKDASEEEDVSLPQESISSDRIREELSRLRDDKKAQFSMIFEPKGRYLSLYCRKGTFVVELAFANRTLRACEKKFKEAVGSAGAIAREFDSNGMGGYEATLGSDLGMSADKVRRIFASTFDVTGDAKIPIQRD